MAKSATAGNQRAILANQRQIIANQKKLDRILANQARILANQKRILAKKVAEAQRSRVQRVERASISRFVGCRFAHAWHLPK